MLVGTALGIVGACAGPPSPDTSAAAGSAAGASATVGSGQGRVAGPVAVRLGSLGIDAAVVPVGVTGSQMEVPRDVATVGWYRFGPGPGSDAGSAVLSGHVDDREQGAGAFYRLAETRPGDQVQVDLADGRRLAYRATRVDRVDKSTLPVDVLFARDGAPRLSLVTCGGEFDRQAGGYRDNVVVTAVPMTTPAGG